MRKIRKGESFVINEAHLKLLKRMYVNWQDCETGAPEIDPKRPYGNSDVYEDIAEILGWKLNRDGELSEGQEAKASKLHSEMMHVLQICLCLQTFETGSYVLTEDYNDLSWKKVI